MQKILILGPQGCGKGTQASLLSKKLGIPTISMGKLLREAAAEGGEFGRRISDAQERGELVPLDAVIAVLQARLARPDMANGYILDGFPRDEEQYTAYAAIDAPTSVVVMSVPEDISLERLLKRAGTEGRADDTPEAIKRRLAIYHAETVPIIREYDRKQLVQHVDATGTIEEVAARIAALF